MWGLTPTLLLLLGFLNTIEGKFEIDILEVNWNISTPEVIDINFKAVQPSRGTFGVSGYIDFKQDVNTDTTMVQVKVFYSSNGISYQLSPFRVPEQTFTKGLNTAYKQYLMEQMNESCENAPEADVFVSPLSKRLIKCENFLFPSDNFPPALRLGYYRLVIMLYDDPGMNLSILLKVDL